MKAETLLRAWLVVAMLWLVALLNYLDRIMITTMRLSLREAIPMSDEQFGLLTSVFLWVYAGLSPLGGFLADRFSRSHVIVGSLLVWSLVTWLTGQARNFQELLLARAIMGLSEACYIPAALALIADYHRGPTRSLATGVHMSGILAGSALGGLGGVLAERFGWSYAFTLFGLFGTGYAVLLAFTLRDVRRENAEIEGPGLAEKPPAIGLWDALASLFGQGTFLLLVVYWGVMGMAGWVMVGWLPTYMNERFHLAQGAAGMTATGYYYTAAALGVMFGGAWADRWSRTNPRARILVPVIGLCAAAAAFYVAADTSLLAVAVAGLVVCGFTRTFADANMMPILCLVVDPRYRATGYGVLNLFSCLLGGIASWGGGALKDAGVNLSFIFQMAAGIFFLCAVLLFLVKPRRAEDAA